MTDELLQTSALGLAATLLAFELVVAARSWYDARPLRQDGTPPPPWLGRPRHGPLLLSRAFAIRAHIVERRNAIRALRRRYETLGTYRYGRRLREEIGRLRPPRRSEVTEACPSCRSARLKGHDHCIDCGRRLVTPAVTAWT